MTLNLPTLQVLVSLLENYYIYILERISFFNDPDAASSSGASIFAETKREQSEREARVTGDEREARGTTGRRRKASETPARKRVDFLAILSFSWHSHFFAFLSLESRQF